MPYLNKYWETYGCEKCDDYNCLVLDVNGYIFGENDDYEPQNVASANKYVEKYGLECPYISRWVGGGQIFCQTNGFSYGGSTYIIRPDRTWKEMSAYAMNENDIPLEGVEPHVCAVNILSNKETAGDYIKFKKTAKTIEVYIPFTGSSIVSISDVKGRALSSFRASGKRQWYSISKEMLSGVIIVNIKNLNGIIIKKFCFVR